jgi:hypothetical protein
MYDDNPIALDTDSRSKKKQKISCVLCKIELDCINVEENRYKCPRCKNSYQLGYEIIPQEDSLESSHESDYENYADNEDLLTAGNDLEFDDDNDYDDETKSDIPIPKYMKSSATISVVEYREE